MPRTAAFDVDDIDTRPKRRRHAADDTPHETYNNVEAPRKRRRSETAADEEHSHRTNSARRSAVAGWDEFEAAASSSNNTDFEAKNALKLRVTNSQQLIKILQDAPFDSFGLHYVQEIKTGKRSFRCGGDSCPLCDDLDHYARKLALFNVALFNESTNEWEHRVWEVGVKIGRKLKAINDDPKRGPLDKDNLYFAISKTGKGTSTEYHLETVKARDLDEDWDVDEIDSKTLTTLKEVIYTDPWERFSSPQELKRVVHRLLEDDTEEDDE
ncbi:hypothetical protein ADL22_12295 [Streptomyces sp. NRRL F-4489]|uniref:hypothetical protein n=1 Tax=Streptomyces sp. NRRL F-4489 TaxID=1609095 RepID=UPI00074ADCE7|nr:hypothetical protein [Streptomyces sp. NRRL F-4489]KUL44717.1 hypothetical protein ADL22_12295 [Streptomyces sp. NRRL F-4489]